jgi:hypothetical protein
MCAFTEVTHQYTSLIPKLISLLVTSDKSQSPLLCPFHDNKTEKLFRWIWESGFHTEGLLFGENCHCRIMWLMCEYEEEVSRHLSKPVEETSWCSGSHICHHENGHGFEPRNQKRFQGVIWPGFLSSDGGNYHLSPTNRPLQTEGTP